MTTHVVHDTTVLLERSLRHILRSPDTIITTAVTPIAMLLLFVYVFGGAIEVEPILEMFNTFNNTNNINPLSTPALFNFDGFLRAGVGDPRQAQLAVKVVF